MSLFVDLFSDAVCTSVTIFFVVNLGFFETSLVTNSILSEISSFLPVFNLFTTQFILMLLDNFIFNFPYFKLRNIKATGIWSISITLLVRIAFIRCTWYSLADFAVLVEWVSDVRGTDIFYSSENFKIV